MSLRIKHLNEDLNSDAMSVYVPARASVTASVTLPIAKLILSEKCGRAPTVRYGQIDKINWD